MFFKKKQKKSMKKNMLYIEAIDQAFLGMEQRNECFVIVRTFEVGSIFLPAGDSVSTNNLVRIDLLRKYDVPTIRILYDGNKQECFPFYSDEEKEFVVEYLKHNNILPTLEEFLEARSLINTEGIASTLAGCDYEDIITEIALASLNNKNI